MTVGGGNAGLSAFKISFVTLKNILNSEFSLINKQIFQKSEALTI